MSSKKEKDKHKRKNATDPHLWVVVFFLKKVLPPVEANVGTHIPHIAV